MAPAMPSSFNYLGNRIGCVVGVFVSPDTNNRPAQRPQSLVSVGVSRAVGLDLSRQKSALLLGQEACSGQPCQKQPSTKMAIRVLEKTISATRRGFVSSCTCNR